MDTQTDQTKQGAMKHYYQWFQSFTVCGLLLAGMAGEAQAQFNGKWLDIGSYHHIYVESGARQESATTTEGMEWPAILRQSSHDWAQAFWIGVKDWTDERGVNFPYYVARIGPRNPGLDVSKPIQNNLIARYEDTRVLVDGVDAFDNVAVVNEINPNLPADRMVDNIYNMIVGVTTHRKAYAYVNQFHDNYHLIENQFCNTGNTDDDPEIELDGQALNDVYFFYVHRWRGNAQEGWATDAGQTWGKYSMVDVVGDGHADYLVDFTAIYLWPGYASGFTRFNNLGGPLYEPTWLTHPREDFGRLAGGSFVGRMTLHADQSASDNTYHKCTNGAGEFDCQPHSLGFMDQDEALTGDGHPHRDYYELGILTRENPAEPANASCPTCSSRQWPHYADRIQPNGEFWSPTGDASSGKQGGHAPTVAYGPYDLAFGECINVVVSEGASGLSFDARVEVGRTYKNNNGNDQLRIGFDANRDGQITDRPFRYDVLYNGSEVLTKNQWVMTARDSLFQTFTRARNLWTAGNPTDGPEGLNISRYPIREAPHAPTQFRIFGRPNRVDLEWDPPAGGPTRVRWEVYRTNEFEDNLPYTKVAELPPTATTYEDRTAQRGVDYFYYIVAVGEPQTVDPNGINGTPGGMPLTSSRYLTQSYLPTRLTRSPFSSAEATCPEAGRIYGISCTPGATVTLPGVPYFCPESGKGADGQSCTPGEFAFRTATKTVKDARVVPNPVNLGSDGNNATGTIRFAGTAGEDQVGFLDIPGNCTIKIFTELGELVKVIEHTNGSGDEFWNLTTDARQLIVSGIYIAVIQDNDTGERSLLKFVVIR
jgi:hypothetical protein